ncbi:hypothetical protein AMAG_19865 [Allomyces macrogynus ATCC 38327]|uniref:Uncharacterized protein n=1 Tax=Allomyces macrogynus (strain ATCC 38327) TaxID=578462 RepID=A0A0L0T2K1_ALLM3|nr:hypothetical protein AMAG_19865 [Allomyces macrogynus ATCC 38327]|eukprot:KNE68819.1 hypothetical protein AMAG_19865 [Allomyces macrogynus ATCC 38327]
MVGPNLDAERARGPRNQLDAPWNPLAEHDARLLAEFRNQCAAAVRWLAGLATAKAVLPPPAASDAISQRDEIVVVDDHVAPELPSSVPANALATLSTGPASDAVVPTPALSNGSSRQPDDVPTPAASASRPSKNRHHANHATDRAPTPVHPVAVPDRRFPAPPPPEAAPELASPPRDPTPPPPSPPAAPPVPLFTMPDFATARSTNGSRRPSNRRRASTQTTAVESVAPLLPVVLESVAPLPPVAPLPSRETETVVIPPAPAIPVLPAPAPATVTATAPARNMSMAATASSSAAAAAAAARTAATTHSMAEYIAAKRRTFGALLRPRSVSVDGSGAALRTGPESVVVPMTVAPQRPVQEEREGEEDEDEEEVPLVKTSTKPTRLVDHGAPVPRTESATAAPTLACHAEPAASALAPVPAPTPARETALARLQTRVLDPSPAAPTAPPPRRSKRLVIDRVEIAVRNPPPPPPAAPQLAPTPSASPADSTPPTIFAVSRLSDTTTADPKPAVTVPATRRSAQLKTRAGPETAPRAGTVDPVPAVPRAATAEAASAAPRRDALLSSATVLNGTEESVAATAAPPAAPRRLARPEPTATPEPVQRAATVDSAPTPARPTAPVPRAASVDVRGPGAVASAPESSVQALRRSGRAKTRAEPEPPAQTAPRTQSLRTVPPRPVSPEPMIVDAPRPATRLAVTPPATRPAAAPSVPPPPPPANDASADDDAMAIDEPAPPQPTLAAMHLAGRKVAKRSIDLSGASVAAAVPSKRRAVAANAKDGPAQPKAAAVPNGDARADRPVAKEVEPVLPPPSRSTRSVTRMAAATESTVGPASSTAAIPELKAVVTTDAPSAKPLSRTSKQGTNKSKRSTDPAATAPAPPAEVPPPPPTTSASARPPARSDPDTPRLNLSAVDGAAVATGPTKSMSLSEQLSAMAQELEDATQRVADRNAASEATLSVSVAVAASTTAVAVPAAPEPTTNSVTKSTQALNNALAGTSKSTAAAAPKPMSLADAVMQYSAKMDKTVRTGSTTDPSQDPHLASRLRLRVARESDARQHPRKLPASASSAAAPPPPTPSRLRMPSAHKPGQVLPPRAPAAKVTAAATAGLMAAVKSAARATELTVTDAPRLASNGTTVATKDPAVLPPAPAPSKPTVVPAPAPAAKPAAKPAAPEPRKPTPPPSSAPAPEPASSSVAARLKAASKAPPEPVATRVVPAPVPAVAKLRAAAAAATADAGRPGTPKRAATAATTKPTTPKPAAAPKPAIPAAPKPAASTARAPPAPVVTRSTPARAAKTAAAAPAPASRAPPPKTPATRPGATAARPAAAAAKPPTAATKPAPPPPKTPAWKKPPVFPPPKTITTVPAVPPKTPSFARTAPSKAHRTPAGRVQPSTTTTAAAGPSESLYSPNTLARDESLFVNDQTDGTKQIPAWAEWDMLNPVATGQAGWDADGIFGPLPPVFKVKEILPWMARRFNWLREDARESKPVPLARGELEQYRVAVVKRWPPPAVRPASS